MLLSRKILPVIVLSTLRTLLISQYLVSIKRAFFFHLRRNIRITEIQAFRFLFIEKFRQNIDLILMPITHDDKSFFVRLIFFNN